MTWGPARRRVLAAVVLVVAAGGCLALTDRTASAPVAEPAPVTEPAAAATRPEPAHPAAPPVHLTIPAIDVSARVIRLGLQPDRTVEVPANPARTGWFELGPTPGEPGSAVILGHVDSVHGPAVFHRLRHLEQGDELVVHAADGSVERFRVTEVATYLNEDFPAVRVYGARGDARALNLVTCGGEYDPDTGYQANVVVYSSLVE